MSVPAGAKKYVFGSIPLIGSKKNMLGELLIACSHAAMVYDKRKLLVTSRLVNV